MMYIGNIKGKLHLFHHDEVFEARLTLNTVMPSASVNVG